MILLAYGDGRAPHEHRHVFPVLNAVHERRPISKLILPVATGGLPVVAHQWAALNEVATRLFHVQWRRFGPGAATVCRNRSMIADGKPDAVIIFSRDEAVSSIFRHCSRQGYKFLTGRVDDDFFVSLRTDKVLLVLT